MIANTDQRFEPDVTARGFGRMGLISEEGFPILRVVVAHPGTLLGLSHACASGLPISSAIVRIRILALAKETPTARSRSHAPHRRGAFARRGVGALQDPP